MGKILILEDTPEQLNELGTYLKNWGHDPVCCENITEAREAIKEESGFQLAVLDVRLDPSDSLERGGFRFAEEIKETKTNLPIIFVTAVTVDIERIRGRSLRCWDYISKPYNPEEMRLVIQNILTHTIQNSLEDDIRMGDLIISERDHYVEWKGQRFTPTYTEMLLIGKLGRGAGSVASSYDLLDCLVDSQKLDSVHTHIRNIRKQFRKLDREFNPIENIYGQGYRLNVGP